MAKKKLLHGTIFAVPLPDGTFLCGRVLLDVESVLKRRLLPHDSPLPFYRDGHLIEMYSGIEATPTYSPSRILIPGAFVEKREIGDTWPIVGHADVDPRTVEFPESLIGFTHSAGDVAFGCGEFRLPLPMKEEVIEQEVMYLLPSGKEHTRVRGCRHSSFLWPYVCLRVMGGRDDEIPEGYKAATLEHSDLRISPHRDEIYAHLPFTKEQSYFERQAQLGLDFERLYEE